MVAGVVKLVGDGTMGRYLSAIRGSEVASSAVGIDVYRLRVLVFALSAGLAGVGGALYGSLEGSLSPNDFNYQISRSCWWWWRSSGWGRSPGHGGRAWSTPHC